MYAFEVVAGCEEEIHGASVFALGLTSSFQRPPRLHTGYRQRLVLCQAILGRLVLCQAIPDLNSAGLMVGVATAE
jgi:hypothetical protein